jgi:P4 family phage/plasmid primase-like protien
MGMDKKTAEYINDPDKLAEGFLHGYIYDPDPDGEFKAGKAYYTLQYYQGTFYRWDSGRHIKISESEIRLLVKRFLHDINLSPDVEPVKVTGYLVSNIVLCIAGMEGVHIPESRQFNSWKDGREKLYQTISFNNGLLLFGRRNEGPVLLPHTPKYFTTVRLPYDFDPDATYLEWEEFLLDVMDGDAERVVLLQQWAGYLLIYNLRQQKFLLITGEGANGKGVFFEIIERMVGRENCSHIPLAQFGKPFVLATTIGKVVNLSSESSSAIDSYGETVLKSYTAGDSMSFQRKYLEAIEVIPTAKVMLATNQLPKFQDKTQGIWRRMLFVPFEKAYAEDEQNKNLADELARGLHGVFNWALKGMQLLQEEGGFINPVKCRNAIEDYKRNVNPARAFLQDNYEVDLEAEGLSCDVVYSNYTHWCQSNGCKPLNSSNFGKEVKRTLGIEKFRGGSREHRVNIYSGLRTIMDVEINKPNFQANNDEW